MSWAAHELESYFIQKHTKTRVSYLAILLGCFLPDLFTKLPVYGFTIGDFTLRASDPAQYHRGWPGVGFTHSLMFGVVAAGLVLWRTRSRAWSLGLLLGCRAHVLTDCFDSVGTMLFFPFTTQRYSTGTWAYASQQGRYGDASAYYSSLGGVWDFLWLLLAISGYSVFSKKYFFSTVVPSDPAWGWLQRTFGLSPLAMLTLYRSYFLYGGCRVIAWFVWSRWFDDAPLDWSWGGPFWVDKVHSPTTAVGDFLLNTAAGLLGLTVTLWLGWRLAAHRWWRQAADRSPPDQSAG